MNFASAATACIAASSSSLIDRYCCCKSQMGIMLKITFKARSRDSYRKVLGCAVGAFIGCPFDSIGRDPSIAALAVRAFGRLAGELQNQAALAGPAALPSRI